MARMHHVVVFFVMIRSMRYQFSIQHTEIPDKNEQEGRLSIDGIAMAKYGSFANRLGQKQV